MNLNKKYSCVVFKDLKKSEEGMINKLRNFIAYGKISEEMYEKLVEARGQKGTKFFTLHPPRKGIDSKKHFGVSSKGVLGDNKEKINDLIERML
jgi:hypothetical protein